MNERYKLLKSIQSYGFAVKEANLYLDSHPDNKKALDYFRKMARQYAQAVEEFEEKHGPLTIPSAACDERWQWIDDPWPWEGED